MHITEDDREVLSHIFRRKTTQDIKALCKWLFPTISMAQNLTDRQADLIKKIAFVESKRINIRAMTRYGKTNLVAIAICIYILINENKRIRIVAPTTNHSNILKNYITDLVVNSRNQMMVELSHLIPSGKEEKLKAEASQSRLTFKNGCEYQILSVGGNTGNTIGGGEQVMGHGADLLVIDESALIKRNQYSKILRMLGDDPENSVLVELLNPWDRDTVAYDHIHNPRYDVIKIGWQEALEEGRITEEYIQEKREDLNELEFQVLFESEFPEQGEDSLFKVTDVKNSYKLEGIPLKNKYEFLQKRIQDDYETNHRERELIKEYKIVMGIDPADKGVDKSVCIWGFNRANYYEFEDYFSEDKSDSYWLSIRIYNKIIELYEEYRCIIEVKVDSMGVGAGVLSNLNEWFKSNNNIMVEGAVFGERASDYARFQNKKAENYWRCANLIKEGLIKLPQCNNLYSELLNIKWEYSSSTYKIKIIDPEKSPDFADALVIALWQNFSEYNEFYFSYL